MWANIRRRLPSTHAVLVDQLETAVAALRSNSELSSILDLSEQGPTLYNAYLAFAVAVYVAKFRQLYEAVGESLDACRYLVYAQAGRSIIENAASLRYYARHKNFRSVKSKVEAGSLTSEQLDTAISALDQMVRGSRFTWEAFVEGRFQDLCQQPETGPSQANIKTCLDHWYKENPKLESLYNFLCELVHPNLGSNLTVIKSWEGKLAACGKHGEDSILFIVAPTLAGIVGVYNQIQQSFLELEAHKIVHPSYQGLGEDPT